MQNIETISLRFNKIKEIENKAFDGLLNLREIFLEGNKLKNTFNNLKLHYVLNLSLSKNKLISFDARRKKFD